MTALASFSPPVVTLEDLLERLGGISPRRIRMHPSPGTAKPEDLDRIQQREGRLFELEDGGLVEKAMGIRESIIPDAIISALRAIVAPQKLGIVTGEAGMMEL